MAGQIASALYLDVPYIVDSVWRRADYNLNRCFRYRIEPGHPNPNVTLSPRPAWQLPAFWLYAVVLVFLAYGPTFDALCSLWGAQGMARARGIAGGLFFIAAAALLLIGSAYGTSRCNKRFRKANVPAAARLRRTVVRLIVEIGVCLIVLPPVLIGLYLVRTADAAVCHTVPSALPAWLQLVLTLGALGSALLVARGPSVPRARAFVGFVLLTVLAGLLWGAVAPPAASEALQTPYPHVFGVAALTIAGIAAMAPSWSRFQFKTMIAADRAFYTAQLGSVELFPGSRYDPPLTARRIIAATATGVGYHLAQLVLMPSLFLLIVPADWIVFALWAGILVAVALLTVGNLTSRWRQMVRYIDRVFLTGTALAVSIVVMLLAILRLLQVQYVTTVLDAAPFGVIFIGIVMTYALFWWFEYVTNTVAACELLRLLGNDQDCAQGRVPYVPLAGAPLTMPATGRWIAPHGIGRFVAMGWFPDKDDGAPTGAFQAYDLVELFSELTPAGQEDRRNDLKRRVQLYFLLLNVLVIAAFLAFALGYYGHADRNNTVAPVVAVAPTDQELGQADLQALLRRQGERQRPALVVAASGGGTRAALYTASALEGLDKLGVSADVVLLSGVSGGGVAAAYFYAHRNELLATDSHHAEAWRTFSDRMTEPFIGDVLEGASEWRFVSRNALGVLLKESFDRRLFNGSALQHLGDASEPALILNTTVTGHPQEDSALLRDMFIKSPATLPCAQQHGPYANISGGRLIFTNLSDRAAFPSPDGEPSSSVDREYRVSDVHLPYEVVQSATVPLSAAAALNANFPPVFTNARVSVPTASADGACTTRSYYVTDGGATENLGLLSALYALHRALQGFSEQEAAKVPEIHLVLLEASATTYDYTPDRGINAATGGSKERLSGGLTQELLEDVGLELDRIKLPRARLSIHYLAMPLAFRSRGGFGTHWMFPQSIEIENPRTPHPVQTAWLSPWWQPPHQTASTSLDRCELMGLWAQLYDPVHPFCETAPYQRDRDAQQVADWVCGNASAPPLRADQQIAQWQQLIDALQPWRTTTGADAALPVRQCRANPP